MRPAAGQDGSQQPIDVIDLDGPIGDAALGVANLDHRFKPVEAA